MKLFRTNISLDPNVKHLETTFARSRIKLLISDKYNTACITLSGVQTESAQF